MYNKPMRAFRRETALYLLAFCIGLVIRLIGLGAAPLADVEAKWALQAFDISSGARSAVGSQPAYVLLTSALFFVLGGASNALARLVPALVGSGLILVPALFRDRLKARPAVILAFALALEPGLAAISRQAGSSILAVTFALAAWGLWERHLPHWAGIFAGMALLSGPGLWVGLLGLALARALLLPFERGGGGKSKPRLGVPRPDLREDWIKAGLYGLGTIVLLGTMFMTVPAGLGAWTAGLPEYIASWTRASDISVGVMLSSLIAYEPVAVILGMTAIIRGWMQGSVRVRRLTIWMVVALLLALFNPSRQVVDLGWMLIPLWALASLELARNLDVRPTERREVLGAVALGGIILVYVWMSFLELSRSGIAPQLFQRGIWLLLGLFLVLVISMLLVAIGWSLRAARHGTIWGLTAFLGLYSISALMAATGLRYLPNGAEMWRPGAELPMAGLLLSTVQEQSAWSNADVDAQPVTIAGIDSPALQWLLRDREVEMRSTVGTASKPPMVITRDEQDPALVSAYRGQSFVWRSTPLWRLFKLDEWLPFHAATHENEKIILWVRIDLFPDGKSSTTP